MCGRAFGKIRGWSSTQEGVGLWRRRYRALAGHALRALRLDLMLTVLHHLQELPGNRWACQEEDAVEVCRISQCPEAFRGCGPKAMRADRQSQHAVCAMPAQLTCSMFSAHRAVLYSKVTMCFACREGVESVAAGAGE